MSEPPLTKRLHISGLTPSITVEDLDRRLSSFGKVKAMDGFGARDALGDPRKFAFVTMEIGAKELQKCLSVLSGSTWKGARLRIGEAKPDFQERLTLINSQPPRPTRPKRHNYGRPSSTLPLTLLSATAAASTPGWIVTPSGRVVRPMRMRPERPLEPMRSEPRTSNLNGMNVKVKKRVKLPPVRARRRLIDPTKWDSAYLKGVFLDAVPFSSLMSNDTLEVPGQTKRGIVDEEDRDVERDERSISEGEGEDESFGVIARSSHEEVVDEVVAHDRDVAMEELSPPAMQTAEPAPSTNLKALFAPREDASFSLLEHLDLDLDIDAEIFGINAPAGSFQENDQLPQPVLPDVVQIPATTPTTKPHARTLDPLHPLLFPLPDSLPHPYTHSPDAIPVNHRNTPTCFLFPSTTRSRNLHHLPTSITFTRSPQDTSESIRERWEKDKSALTHEWKKAWREARGSRRGGKGAGGEIGGGY